jgi:hypothetical protein
MIKTKDVILEGFFGFNQGKRSNDPIDFFENWDVLTEITGKDEMQSLYFAKDDLSDNILHIALKSNSGIILQNILGKFKRELNPDEIRTLILSQNNFRKSPLLLAVEHRNLQDVKYIWDFIKEHTDRNDQQKLLKMRSYRTDSYPFCGSTLECSKNETKEFIKTLYEDLIFNEKIQTQLETDGFTYVRCVLVDANITYSKYVFEQIQNIYKNNNKKLQKLLLDRDEDGTSLFSIKFKENSIENNQKLDILRDILKNSFSGMYSERFEIISKAITFSSPRVKMFENNDKTKLKEDLFVIDNTIRFKTWNLADFVAFFDNYEDIKDFVGEEGVKNILSSKNVKDGNVVGDFLELEFVNKFYENFIKIFR